MVRAVRVPALFLVAEVTRRRGGLRDPVNLPLAVLVITLVVLVATPFQNAVSRRYEAEADWRALQTTHDPRRRRSSSSASRRRACRTRTRRFWATSGSRTTRR